MAVTEKTSAKPSRKRNGAADREPLSPTELVVDLNGPGMTPLLRAGVGGLASALRALARERNARTAWPVPVQLADGEASVEAHRVVLRFGKRGPKPVLEDLFARVFRLTTNGVISPMGLHDRDPSLGLAIALQLGWKRTFLQHGKMTKKAGSSRIVQTEIDDRLCRYSLQPFAGYEHQAGAAEVLESLHKGTVKLTGWAYPGAAQKHSGFTDTKCEYTAAQALAAMFAFVGCLSHPTARGAGGVLVAPIPGDLVAFASLRPKLTPKLVADVYVTGVGDAVLAMSLALKLSAVVEERRGIVRATGLLLRPLPWANKLKSRVSTLDAGMIADQRLDEYEVVVRTLRSQIRETADSNKDEDEQDADGFFVATSAFRGFVTDNIAEGKPWFAGFATANTGGKRPRYIHYFRNRDSGLGALYPEEKKGIIAMTEYLERAEKMLVESVHIALRGRFAQIAKDAADSLATMKNRFKGERERLRLAFAGAKTPEQIRGALADLWSRGGTNRELQANWREVLPLLRPERWQVARDLALVALASYQSASRLEDDDDDKTDSGNDGAGER